MSPLGNYNPYQSMESWYGVPDYGGAYNSYLGAQQQPMSLQRLVSMVRDIQNSQSQAPMGPIGQQAVSMSLPTQAQIPAQIAASIMNTGNRLLSTPRQQVAQSGFNQLPEENLQPNAPADNQPSGGGGGGARPSGSGSNYNAPAMPTLQTSANSPYKQAVGSAPSGGSAQPSLSGSMPKVNTANYPTGPSQSRPTYDPGYYKPIGYTSGYSRGGGGAR